MEGVVGILKVRVIRGTNLAVRDIMSSDPYVVVRLGDQKVKTRVIRKNLNPVWDEELSVFIPHSNLPSLKVEVYDKDTLSRDDKMGDAQVDLGPLGMAVRMRKNEGMTDLSVPDGNNLSSMLAKESCIKCVDGHMVQDLRLRLQNVESGELELQIKWVDLTE